MSTQEITLPTSMAEQGEQWRKLRELVVGEGLLERQYLYYASRILLILLLLGVSLWCLVVIDTFWVEMVNALFLAFVSTQIMLMGHASIHGEIFGSWRNNYVVSLGIGLLAGLSRLWWEDKHNRGHHENPNNVDFDDDVNVSVLAFTEEQALKKKGFDRFVVKYQHVFVVPILFLTALSFRSASFNYLLSQGKRAQPASMAYLMIEFVLLLSHIIGYFLLLFSLSNPWWHMIPFVLVHQGFTGLYMGSIFATNHKGRYMFGQESKVGFLLRQVLPSRDLKNPWFLDFLFGGLNFQIEHHLFPSMPENNLPKAQKIVKAFCGQHDIEYCETGVFQAVREIFGHFRRVSAPLRA